MADRQAVSLLRSPYVVQRVGDHRDASGDHRCHCNRKAGCPAHINTSITAERRCQHRRRTGRQSQPGRAAWQLLPGRGDHTAGTHAARRVDAR